MANQFACGTTPHYIGLNINLRCHEKGEASTVSFVESDSFNPLLENTNLDRERSIMVAEARSFARVGGAGAQDGIMAPGQKIIRDRAFAQRLAIACDGNPRVPLHNHGRLGWISNQLKERFGTKASLETVRRWFSGEMKPRPDKTKQLAEILEVDAGWLALGVAADLSPREVKTRNAIAEGAVNVLAGFIQIAGGSPAFPDDGDTRAEQHHIHLYAIIKGAQYAFHVTLGRREENGDVRFVLPPSYRETFVVGAIPTEGPGMIFVELPTDWLEVNASRKGGMLEVTIKDVEVELRRLRNFGERI